MKARMTVGLVSVLSAIGLFAAGCGSGGGSSATAPGNASSPSNGRTAEQPEAAGAAPSEAESAATGDIPDNQTFLRFRNTKAGYTIRYPEGWARQGAAKDVTFQEKANLIHVVVSNGPSPTVAIAARRIAALHKVDPTVKSLGGESVSIGGEPVVKVRYSRLSAPDPVTGKRLPLIIDRYEYGRGGKVAIVDLATPVGVDNVDAYRMISESFRWLS